MGTFYVKMLRNSSIQVTTISNFSLKLKIYLTKLLDKENKNKRWRPRKQLKAADITKSTFERLKTLNLKRFWCIHLHTIFLIHRESQTFTKLFVIIILSWDVYFASKLERVIEATLSKFFGLH